jgi:hypothetical protein
MEFWIWRHDLRSDVLAADDTQYRKQLTGNVANIKGRSKIKESHYRIPRSSILGEVLSASLTPLIV